jgi:hypothetical protein
VPAGVAVAGDRADVPTEWRSLGSLLDGIDVI